MSKKKLKDTIKDLIPYILILVAVWGFTSFIATGTKVDGYSMYPTFSDKDLLLTDRLAYRIGEVERFDVVIFNLNENNNNGSYYLIKRVIGLPGETIHIDGNGNIYINGKLLDESYGAEPILDPGMAAETITLADNEYFVLGDNRNNSLDSRFEPVGIVHKDQIIGEAFVQLYPFNKFGGI